jgi:hypothetical protein
VILKQVAKANTPFFDDYLHEVGFDLVGIRIFRQTQSLRYTHDVGIDADGILTESVAEDNVGRFPTDAGKD